MTEIWVSSPVQCELTWKDVLSQVVTIWVRLFAIMPAQRWILSSERVRKQPGWTALKFCIRLVTPCCSDLACNSRPSQINHHSSFKEVSWLYQTHAAEFDLRPTFQSKRQVCRWHHKISCCTFNLVWSLAVKDIDFLDIRDLRLRLPWRLSSTKKEG